MYNGDVEMWRRQKSTAEHMMWREAELGLDATEGGVWVTGPDAARGRLMSVALVTT